MSLSQRTCVGPYEVLSLIGAGGMGEVYRAHDTRLDRDVALKILPTSVAADQDRMRRFALEARSAGGLNHPHILAIYDVGTHEGTPYIVSELLQGDTLRARLASGKPSVAKTVEMIRQVASGLAAAHAKGIIHRDIKPENLFLTKDGVKILDFGLAKVSSAPPTRDAVTETINTSPGLVVGTPAYMSPEQVRGDNVDQRSDIFSLGCVLYESLAGRPVFQGATSVEIMNAILKEDPPELPGIPSGLKRIVWHCLEKNPDERFQSARDLAFNLETLAEPPARKRAVAIWMRMLQVSAVLALAAAAVVIAVRMTRSEPTTTSPARLAITLPADAPLAPGGLMPIGHDLPALALSPDGARLAYVAQVRDRTQINVRDMATGKIVELSGTANGHTPFFSPDGAFVGFFAEGKLRKVPVSGGSEVVLADAPNPWGAVWGADGDIYFNRFEGEGIFRISSDGGPVQVVSKGQHYAPELLGPGPLLLATGNLGSVVALESGKPPKTIVEGFGARYVRTGHLVYAVNGKLMAVPFDRSRVEVTGSAVSLFDDLRTAHYGVTQFAVAQNGTLIYASGRPQLLTSFVWVDRKGNTRPLGLPEDIYSAFDLSPDGKHLALTDSQRDIWIYDIPESTSSRLTRRVTSGARVTNSFPRWTPDGKHVVFMSRSGSQSQLLSMPVDGSMEPVAIWSQKPTGPEWLYPMSFSPDGSVMVVFGPSANTSFDLFLMRMANGVPVPAQEPELFLGTSFGEAFGQLSPDGRWMLYSSDQSGGYEIYVTSYPKPGAVHQITRNGGREPVWNPRGSEILYVTGTMMYAVDVTLSPEFKAGQPRLLFQGSFPDVPGHGFDITSDGRQFLMLENRDFLKPSTELTVITNFFDLLRRRVPSRR